MRLAAYNRVCAALPVTFKTVQWRGCHVWKVGDAKTFKMFAIGAPVNEVDEAPCAITIKVSPMIHPILMELEGVGRHSHMPHGDWIRIEEPSAIDDDTLASHIAAGHALAVASLTKKARAGFGL